MEMSCDARSRLKRAILMTLFSSVAILRPSARDSIPGLSRASSWASPDAGKMTKTASRADSKNRFCFDLLKIIIAYPSLYRDSQGLHCNHKVLEYMLSWHLY